MKNTKRERLWGAKRASGVLLVNLFVACNCGDDRAPLDGGRDAGTLSDSGFGGGGTGGGAGAGGGSGGTGGGGGSGGAGGGEADSGTVVSVTLSASVNPVVTEMPVTLSAAVVGTATQVEFLEDGVSRGVDVAAPFAHQRTYLFAENGAHQWIARASVDGGTVSSAPLTLTVAILAAGLYVATTGDDANPGTLAAPLKTLQRARMLASTGQTIWLLDGVFNSSNQTTWGVTFPSAVYVRGYDAGAVLEGTTSSGLGIGLTFSNGGGLRDVTIRRFATGVLSNAGTFDMRSVAIDNTTIPFSFRGDVAATVEDCTVVGTPPSAFATLALVEGTSSVSWRGGRYENIAASAPGFFVRDQATFTAEDVVIRNHAGAALNVWDNSRATLRRVQISDAGSSVGSGIARAAIFVGAQNSAVPLTTTIRLESSSVTGSRGPGIGFQQYDRATQQRVTLIDSHLDRNAGAGLEVTSPSFIPDGGLLVTAINSTFDGNAREGVLMTRGAAELTGGSVSNNGQHGLRLVGAAENRLYARETRFSGNGGHGLWFNGNTAARLDLGTGTDAGNLTFTSNAANHSGVLLEGPVQGQAVGNTWEPNQQFSDDAGRYVAPLTFSPGASGRNVTVLDGGSLVVR